MVIIVEYQIVLAYNGGDDDDAGDVDDRERLVEEFDRTGDLLVDLGSDQTSCHNPFQGGYYPVQVKLWIVEVVIR